MAIRRACPPRHTSRSGKVVAMEGLSTAMRTRGWGCDKRVAGGFYVV